MERTSKNKYFSRFPKQSRAWSLKRYTVRMYIAYIPVYNVTSNVSVVAPNGLINWVLKDKDSKNFRKSHFRKFTYTMKQTYKI